MCDRLSPSKTCGPVSRMDERTVRDLEKCFCRVIQHLNDQGGGKNKSKGKRRGGDTEEDPPSRDLLQEVLPIVLYFLDLQPLVSLPPAGATQPMGILPLHVDRDDVSRGQRERMRRLSLDLLSALVAHLDRADLFPLWMIFFPGCARSPYALSLMDKLSPSPSPSSTSSSADLLDFSCQSRLVSVVGAFVDKVGPFLRFVERPSASLGFTPLYQSLGESLLLAHDRLVDHVSVSFSSSSSLHHSDSAAVTGASRALASLVKNCPYRKLGFEPLKQVLRLSGTLLDKENPVLKIAGLNLHLNVMLAVAGDGGGGGGGREVLDPREGCSVYIRLSLPAEGVADNNVRYVSLQNLGHLASKSVGSLVAGGSVDDVTRMVGKNLRDADGAVVLHTLRLCKWLAKHDPSKRGNEEDAESSLQLTTSSTSSASPFMPLWNLLLRPRSFQSVEARSDPNLEALLCDVVSELGEAAFAALTQDQRALCVSYVLCRCHGDCASQVRSSAFRALGLLLAFRGLRDDVSFLTDCTETIAGALSSRGGGKIRSGTDATTTSKTDWRTTLTCATWMLASLSDALLEVHKSEAVGAGEDDQLPRVHVLRLVTILSESSRLVAGGNVIAQVNLLRCTGALLQCVDEAFLSGGSDGGSEAAQEVLATVGRVLDFVLCSIRGGSPGGDMMKVRWNACHAAGRIFQNDHLLDRCRGGGGGGGGGDWRSDACEALMSAVESCPNFKVKISACAAMMNLSSARCLFDEAGREEAEGSLYLRAVRVILAELERTDYSEEAGDDGQETKHRLDLANHLVLLFCHLVLKSSPTILPALEASLSRDQVDNLRYVMLQVRRRVSPEQAGLLSEAAAFARSLRPAEAHRALGQIFVEDEMDEAGEDMAVGQEWEEEEEEEEECEKRNHTQSLA